MKELRMKLTNNTGRIAGYSLIVMFLLAIFSLMGLDEKVIVKGDTAATLHNITTYKFDFWVGVIGYFIILILDIIVSIAFYSILKSANRTFALITAILRLAYTAVAMISLTALAFYYSNVYVNGLLIAYFFFILHLFLLGITILKSKYIPKFFGILLVVSVPCYIILIYGELFLSADLLKILMSIVMGPAVLAEMLFAIWLIIKSKKIPDRIEST